MPARPTKLPPWALAKPGRQPSGAGGRKHLPMRPRRTLWLVALVLIVATGTYLLDGRKGDTWRQSLSPISGPAYAVDGDTLRLAESSVRLLGIDAPEIDQPCTDATGVSWACGEAARDSLASLVEGNEVRCMPTGRDTYGRILARCTLGQDDLGAELVSLGFALSEREYFPQQAEARAEKRGVWAGEFAAPRVWRERTQGSDLLAWIRSWFG